MKKLTGKHVFAMAKIIKAANLKEELCRIIAKSQTVGISPEEIGIETIMAVVNACGDDKVEQRVYEFLDDVFETKVADMSLESIIQNLKQLAEENNLIDFFKSAGLLKPQK
jgi:hypothetical protein